MIHANNTAAVVVWFMPSSQQTEHIQVFADVLKHVYVVDNSDKDFKHLIPDRKNITYIPNLDNKGIATALNIGYIQAIKSGAEWILSFDQDSHFTAQDLLKYIQLCNDCPISNVGIYAPYPKYGDSIPPINSTYTLRERVITSGALISADTYHQTGRFRDDYFIDLVDDEYCLRVKKSGYEIVMVNEIILEHHIGNGYVTVPLIHHKFIEHNALRHYYIVRNTLAVIHEYPDSKKVFRRQLRQRIKRLILYDFHDKWNKLKMCYWGYYDYKHHKMGRFSH